MSSQDGKEDGRDERRPQPFTPAARGPRSILQETVAGAPAPAGLPGTGLEEPGPRPQLQRGLPAPLPASAGGPLPAQTVSS